MRDLDTAMIKPTLKKNLRCKQSSAPPSSLGMDRRSIKRSLRTRPNMVITFSGSRIHDPSKSCILFGVVIDGEEVECAIGDDVLKSLCDDYYDTEQIFDSCHMAILDYTRQKLCNQKNDISDQIITRDRV
jgi:hypothetical protein